MPTFAFSGRTRAGQTITGERVGDTVESVTAALRREQILVTKIAAVAAKAVAAPRKARARAVNAKNLAVFTRQFSVMIDAGLPLVQCLDILGNQEEDKNFSAVILATRSDVEAGASLADAMKRHPKTFDPLFTNMIAAGEAGGILDTILKRLATYIEKAVKLKGQVKSAMIYPIAIIVIAALVVTVILWKVIPTFATLFAGLGAELPFLTRMVIAMSNMLVQFMPIIIVVMIGLVFAFRQYYSTEGGRRVIDGIVLKLPVLGPIMRKIAVARFCRTLSTLMTSGVPSLDGLVISGG
ncbi:MAG: type II secretion system F family protein, partial [Vicinamibacterales bacterium]